MQKSMKSKLFKVFGVGFTIMLLASMLVAGVPVSAGTLSWSAETIPSATNKVIAAGTDIVDLAVAADGATIYAVTGTEMYKSTNAGVSWTLLTTAAGAPVELVAVAPDDANYVAFAGDNATGAFAYVSTNGGTSFSALTGIPSVNATADIDISPALSGVRNVAVAGGSAANVTAVDYFNLGATVPVWTAAVPFTGTNPDGMGDPTGGGALAIKFSPNYASDRVLVMVSSNDTTQVFVNIASFASKKWNNDAGFPDYDGVKNRIATGTGIAPAQKASLSLAPTYLAADEPSRVGFVSLATNAGEATVLGGIYRLKDEAATRIGSANRVWSVAYTTGDKLVAGAGDTTVVYSSTNPLATSPTVNESVLYQRPGGVNNVTVAWAGANAVAGTVGNESAFAVSKDNGLTFNDISLIDTALTILEDVAVAADGSIVYLLSDDGADLSVWRYSAAAWQRVAVKIADAGWRVRLAPENANVAYLFKSGATDMLYSTDAGETTWTIRIGPLAIADMAVESASVLYAASGLSVYKSTNAGFIWGSGVSTTLAGVATITSLKADNLLVGGTDGKAAYSTNGGTSWTATVASVAGNLQVTADGLATDNIIYAASSANATNVYRWKIGTNATAWTSARTTTLGTDYQAKGIALVGSALYVIADNSTDTILYRTLEPTTAAADTAWSTKASTGVFGVTPSALRTSTGKLWAIDTEAAPDTLQSFTDTLAVAPTLQGPADKAAVDLNPITGLAYDQAFSWARLSTATAYDIQIALDSAFTQITAQATSIDLAVNPAVAVLGPGAAITTLPGTATATGSVSWMPGVTYYWRIRVAQDGPIFSLWSTVQSFTVGPAVTFVITSPANGAYNIPVKNTNFTWTAVKGATSYEIVVAVDPAFATSIVTGTSATTYFVSTKTLGNSATYYWRVRPAGGDWISGIFTTEAAPVAPTPPVVIQQPSPPEVKIVEVPVQAAIPTALLGTIIGIGAILIIALIVLIVRTRRVV